MCTGHEHDHDHFHGHHEIKVYWQVALITTLTLVLEIIGGLHTRSLSLLSDSFHVAFDLSGNILALAVEYYIRLHPGKDQSKKIIRAWGGIMSSILLFVLVGMVTKDTVEKVFEPHEIKSWQMIMYAVAGLLGNLFSFWLLEKNSQDHITHVNLSAHVFSDLIQSMGVVVIGIVIFLTQWHILDTVGTFFIAIWLLKISISTFKQSLTSFKTAHQ